MWSDRFECLDQDYPGIKAVAEWYAVSEQPGSPAARGQQAGSKPAYLMGMPLLRTRFSFLCPNYDRA